MNFAFFTAKLILLCLGWGTYNWGTRVDYGVFVESVKCGRKHCCVLGVDSQTGEKSFACWGNTVDDSQIGDDFVVHDHAAGQEETCVLSTSGEVKCIGTNHQISNDGFQIPSVFSLSGVRFARTTTPYYHYCIYEESNELLMLCMFC